MEIEYEDDDVSFIDSYSSHYPYSCISPSKVHRRNQEPIYGGFNESPFCVATNPSSSLSVSSSYCSVSSSSSGFPLVESHLTPLQPVVTGYKRKYCSFNSGIIDEDDDNRENYNNVMYMDRIDRVELSSVKGSNYARKITTYGRLHDKETQLKTGRWSSDVYGRDGEEIHFNVLNHTEKPQIHPLPQSSADTGLNKIYELNFRRTSSVSYVGIDDGVCIFCVTQQHEQQMLPIKADHECQFCSRLSCHHCIVVCSLCSHEFCNFCVISPQPSMKMCHDCNRKNIASSPDGVCRNDIIFF